MRVTQGMLSQDMLRQISNSYQKLGTYQEQLASGKKISRPSQDPVVAMMGMSYRSNVTHIEQYQRNLGEAYKWMDNSEAALGQTTDVLQRVRELTVEASNGTYTPEQREKIGAEVDQLKQQLVVIANQKVAGKYIFNGTDTKTPPVDPATFKVTNSGASVNIEINDGVTISVNVDPTDVFTQDLFDDLTQLQSDLANGDSETISAHLTTLDSHIDNVVSARAELGAKYNRVEMIDNRLDQQKVIATRVLSNNEDIDFEKVVMNLKIQESVHRAALAVGARIMQPTLVDFLR